MMQEESRGQPNASDWPWWFRWLQKIACVIASLLCIILGLVACLTLNSTCLLAGVLQVLIGILIFILEAPCCCAFLDFVSAISKFSEERPAYQKALLYCVLPIIPPAICFKISNIIGCVLVFACGLSFAFVALGKKASREEMLMAAAADGQPTNNTSGLVNNAQPMSQTAPPKSSNIV